MRTSNVPPDVLRNLLRSIRIVCPSFPHKFIYTYLEYLAECIVDESTPAGLMAINVMTMRHLGFEDPCFKSAEVGIVFPETPNELKKLTKNQFGLIFSYMRFGGTVMTAIFGREVQTKLSAGTEATTRYQD